MSIITKIAKKPEIVQTTSIPGIPMIMMTKRSVFGLDVDFITGKRVLQNHWTKKIKRLNPDCGHK